MHSSFALKSWKGVAELQIKLTSTKYVPHTFVCVVHLANTFVFHVRIFFKGTLILTTRGQKLTNKVRSYCTHTEPEPQPKSLWNLIGIWNCEVWEKGGYMNLIFCQTRHLSNMNFMKNWDFQIVISCPNVILSRMPDFGILLDFGNSASS